MTYSWDRGGRLLSAGSSSYAYNGLGNRLSQTVSAIVTDYLLDLQPGLSKVLAATTASDTTRFVHDPLGIHAQEDPNGDWHWAVQDGLGSVRAEINASGTVEGTRHFAPYGEPFGVQGSFDLPFGFTGEPTDVNGLVHLRARYLNPVLGVFPSLDLIEGALQQAMSLNRYGYVAGNVANRVDPSGWFGERPNDYAECSPPDSVSSQNDCVDFSNFSAGSVKSDKIHYMHNWGVALTVDCCVPANTPNAEWDVVQRDNVNRAFAEVNHRLATTIGRTFKDVFSGLELRHVNSDDSNISCPGSSTSVTGNLSGADDALTPRNTAGTEAKGRTILWGPGTRMAGASRTTTHSYGLHVVNDIGIQHTIVHELGHVLDYRTEENLSYVAGARDIADNPGFNLRSIDNVAYLRESPREDVLERVADYFLNWVYDTFHERINPYVQAAADSGNDNRTISAYWTGLGVAPVRGDGNYSSPGITQWAGTSSTFARNALSNLSSILGVSRV